MANSELLSAARLERLFNDCFADRYHTRLFGGADEPLYQPARVPGEVNALYYRADYFASALHEVAHWCIAGEQRRQQQDFGYWYVPDNRNRHAQNAFEAVEVKPQALEWFFSRACDHRFRISLDNLALAQAERPDTAAFQHQVLTQALVWQKLGLPARAAVFYHALCREFGTDLPAAQVSFSLAELA